MILALQRTGARSLSKAAISHSALPQTAIKAAAAASFGSCSTHAMFPSDLSHKDESTTRFSAPIRMPLTPYLGSQRNFSTTVASMTQPPQTNAEKIQTLDAAVVLQIKQELIEADVNHDGRIDADELKQVLRRHKGAFTDSEILEIGELFYAGKAGGSVKFEDFLDAMDNAAAEASRPKDETEQFKARGGTLGIGSCVTEYLYRRSHHGQYTPEELDIKLTHVPPKGFRDKLALGAVKGVRVLFDTATGWGSKTMTKEQVLQRVVFLETVAAVPGMVAAIVRHFRSLRTMTRDGGMLNMFLEEAQNERMHLLTFVSMKDPSKPFRVAVIGSQFGFGTAFLLAYIVSPTFCHKFVGYIEEEACHTYSTIIEAIEQAPEEDPLSTWRSEGVPKIARSYWKLGEDSTVLDLMYAVRADEAEHRDVNHTVSDMNMNDGSVNPLFDPGAKLDKMLLKYAKDVMKTGPQTNSLH
eukprot:CAMPEP_0198305932 /NCGR_PEP_ID=MMETSP1449-20131203/58155_1 /TAXON_ID=420275 /ORGANISM="Attheya septentrionalis, Strain CCMP2084" /LENGTH=467 /DNA_ID=CAMNT_0044008477 /DNA_START=70 /DNA_END=1473 /DNA_ORIENTATION=-